MQRVKGTMKKKNFTEVGYKIALPNQFKAEEIKEAIENYVPRNKELVFRNGKYKAEVLTVASGCSKECFIMEDMVIKIDMVKGESNEYYCQTIQEIQAWEKACTIVGQENASNVLAVPYRVVKNDCRGGKETTSLKSGEIESKHSIIIAERLFNVGDDTKDNFTPEQKAILKKLGIGDLRPCNIGRDRDGNLKVLDYRLDTRQHDECIR